MDGSRKQELIAAIADRLADMTREELLAVCAAALDIKNRESNQ